MRVRVPLGALATVPNGRSVQTFRLVTGCPKGREGSTPSGASLDHGPVAERQTHHCSTASATRTVPRSGRGLAWSGRLPRTQENAGSNPAAPTARKPVTPGGAGGTWGWGRQKGRASRQATAPGCYLDEAKSP